MAEAKTERNQAVYQAVMNGIDRKYLLRYARNCGEVMINIIEQVQDYIRNKESFEEK